jgi:hypothetical protein
MPLLVGSGPITLVQNGAITETIASLATPIGFVLPAASQPGTTLVAVAGTGFGANTTIASFPQGWTQIVSITKLAIGHYEVWIYPNQPGGILGVSASGTSNASGGRWYTHLSEWSGVIAAGTLEAFATDTTVAGTTIQPSIATVVNPGDLAIAGWLQPLGSTTTVTFTTPAGFTRLADDGAVSRSEHLDLEYLIGPVAAHPLQPILTSNTASIDAAGALVLLKAATPAVDMTPYLANDSQVQSR